MMAPDSLINQPVMKFLDWKINRKNLRATTDKISDIRHYGPGQFSIKSIN